ncbi:ACP S-malonyltransferase [Arhodomonas sp. AD133]|uniref:ACP S-malonyltransferase n=1 Tax=Arhodomonas sp. AD133 TaxID=3415009 RepID=UPI003EB87F26
MNVVSSAMAMEAPHQDAASDEPLTGSLPSVFMFSGQGSQYHWMGKELFDENDVFRDALRRHDATAARFLGESVLARVFDPAKGKNDPLVDTRITHPAIVMIELALAEAVQAAGIQPDYVIGASLGEYAAAVIAGCLEPEECLRILVDQAQSLHQGPRSGMLAVLADPGVFELAPALRQCDVAARNYPGHFVVAGTEADLARAESELRAAEVLHQRIPVEYGYHSRLMDTMHEACSRTFDGVAFAPPRIPWVSSIDGGMVQQASAEHFWRTARLPIEFEATITRMRERGEFLFLDLGPSGTLHNFVHNNLPEGTRSESIPILSPFGYDRTTLTRARALAAPRRTRKAHTMKVYGFPGQGSQQRGMGNDLFGKYPEQVAAADRILGYSIAELCTQDPERQLSRTEYTQPALFVVSALSYLDRMEEDPTPPDFLVGHSLGEYVALFAAGVFDFETGVRLVHKRGELMAAASGGTMAAIVGTDEATVERVLEEADLNALDLANHNAPDQFVLAGPSDQIDVACEAFEKADARAVKLNVSAPFHSRYMRSTAEEFARFLEGFDFHPPAVPVIANVDARPYPAEAVAVKERLVRQIASPVRWTESVRRLMGHGEFEFVELGPGQVLTRLVTRIRTTATPLDPIEAPDPATTPPPEPAASAPTPEPAKARESVPAEDDASPRDSTGDAPSVSNHGISPEQLGAATFRERYGLRRAYLVGSLYGGISGPDMVRAAARAGLLGFLGTGGLSLDDIEGQLRALHDDPPPNGVIGANLLYRHGAPQEESALVDVFLRHGVEAIEASGFPLVTPALVRFRLKGGRILAKVSRADAAKAFLAPPPERLVRQLLASGDVTEQEAQAAAGRPMADDLCVEAAGGWLDTTADLLTLLPTVRRLRDEAETPDFRVHVGCAGGLGTPEAVAAAFFLGADFVLTGSVNQCSVEAATSVEVKALLQGIQVHDVVTAPWGDMFEFGVQARYVKRGVFFPARASRLHDLWRTHESITELDDDTRQQVLGSYLGNEISTADLPPDNDPKAKLTSLFRHYFTRGLRLAVQGDSQHKVDYLIHCGPALGAFNQLVADTELQPWRARTVERIADTLMESAASYINAGCQDGYHAR